MIISLIFFTIIFLYHSFIYKHDLFCLFNISFILLIVFSNFQVIFEKSKIKRKCFINCIFEKESFLYRLLNNYFFIFVFSLLIAILYTIILIQFLIKTDLINLIIIFVGILFAEIIFNKLSSIGIKKEYNNWILISFVSFISSTLLSFILIIKNYYFSSLPQFLDINFLKTFENISHIYFSNCWVMNKFLYFSNLIDSLNGFIAEKAILLNINSLINIFVAIQFLFVSFIGIFALHYTYFYIKISLKGISNAKQRN